MNKKLTIAFYSYFVAAMIILMVGIIYLSKTEFMPYHSVAVGMVWEQVPREFQILVIALMRAFGGASVALSLAIALLLIIPFKQQKTWAFWAIPSLLLLQVLSSFYAMNHVVSNTNAQPPQWAIFAGLVPYTLAIVCTVWNSLDKKV